MDDVNTEQPKRSLAQNTGFVLAAELVVQGTRAATVFILFRVLGDEQFGVYAGVLALVTLLGPASQWGMNHVTVRAVARGMSFADAWAKATTAIVGGGLVGALVATVVGLQILDIGVVALVLFALAQLIGFGAAHAATMAAEAHHRADVGLWINIWGAVIRMSALGLFIAFGDDSLEQWSYLLFAAMAAWGIWSSIKVARTFGGTHRRVAPSAEDLRLGAGFVFVQTSSSGQTDVDKLVLNGYGLAADAGIYSPGYRIAELGVVPLTALVRSTYAEFFRRGSTAVAEALTFARKLTALAAAYGIVVGIGMFVFAPLVDLVTGDEAVVDVVRWLALIPLLKGLQYFPGNVLTGSDNHNIRSWIIFATALLNVIGNLIFVPDHGWRAAAATTLVSETVFAVLLWLAVFVLHRREQDAQEPGLSPR